MDLKILENSIVIIKQFMERGDYNYKGDHAIQVLLDFASTALKIDMPEKKEIYEPTDEQVGNGAYYDLRERKGYNDCHDDMTAWMIGKITGINEIIEHFFDSYNIPVSNKNYSLDDLQNTIRNHFMGKEGKNECF